MNGIPTLKAHPARTVAVFPACFMLLLRCHCSAGSARLLCSRNVLVSVHTRSTHANNHIAALLPLCSNSDSSSSTTLSSCFTLTYSSKARPVSTSATASQADTSADDDEAEAKPGKPLRVERLLANLGYGKRKECTAMIKRKQLVFADTGQPAKVGEKALASQLLLDGEPLDPAPPLTLMLHKPVGYVVTSPEDEMVTDLKVYDLLPYRFGRRRPFLSSIGRLDKETSGLLLMTDDGQLLHSIQSPTKGIWKRYTASLSEPLEGKEAEKAIQRFASGQLQLQNDRTPLLPAALHMLDPTTAEVSICEGRYHQIRRMFAAVGRTVVALHRHTIGGLSLPTEQDLPLGQWRLVTQVDLAAVMAGPQSFAAAQQQQQPAGGLGPQHQQQQVADAGQLQQHAEPNRLTPSSSNSSSSSSAAAGSSDTRVLQGREASVSAWEGDGDDSSSASDLDEDVDHPGEVAAAVKRFKSSSKRARRRAVLASDVQAIRTQQQQQQQQQSATGR